MPNISISAVKISIFHESLAQVNMLIFAPHEMKNILYFQKQILIFTPSQESET